MLLFRIIMVFSVGKTSSKTEEMGR